MRKTGSISLPNALRELDEVAEEGGRTSRKKLIFNYKVAFESTRS